VVLQIHSRKLPCELKREKLIPEIFFANLAKKKLVVYTLQWNGHERHFFALKGGNLN